MADQLPIDRVREAIERYTGHAGRYHGGSWQLRCPAHHDRNPSLALAENDRHHALLRCHSGCTTEDIMNAIGMGLRDLYPEAKEDRRPDPVIATYDYRDPRGKLIFQVERTVAKRFRQRRPDPDKHGHWVYNLEGVTRVLYRLPQVIKAVADGQTIYVVEGEKDVHTAEALGATATCNPGGAGKWRPEYSRYLAGAEVVIIADNDPSGRGLIHARDIARQLKPVAASVVIGLPVAGKDLTDLHLAGLGLDDITLVETEPTQPELPTPTDIPKDPRQPDDDAPRPPDDPVEDPRQIWGRKASEYRIGKGRWVWRDLPGVDTPPDSGVAAIGEICLIAGREGSGKSTLLAWAAGQISRGAMPGIHQGTPKTVLYATAEDSWSHTIVPRLVAAGADLDRVIHLMVEQDGMASSLNLPQDLQRLIRYAVAQDAAVLLLDPILSMLAEQINPNHARELRGALEPLRAAAETAGISVIGLVHFNKTRDTDIGSMIAGSRAWTEVARTVLAVARDKTDETATNPPLVVTQTKNNIGRQLPRSGTFTLTDTVIEFNNLAGNPDSLHVARAVWGETTELTAEQALQHRPSSGGNGGSGPRSAVSQTDAILNCLRTSPVALTPRQIADALTLDRNAVTTGLNRLLMRGEVRKIGTGLYLLADAEQGAV